MRISREFVPYLNVTARIESAPDQGMLQEKGGNYFPYVVFMDANGEVLNEFRPTSEQAVRNALATARLIVQLKEKLAAEPEDAAARAGLQLLKGLSGNEVPNLEELDRLARTPGLDPKVAARYKAERPRLVERVAIHKLRQIFREASQAMRRGEPEAEVNRRRDAQVYALYKEEGVYLKAGVGGFAYYAALINGALNAGDVACAKKALPDFERAVSRVIESLKKRQAAGGRWAERAAQSLKLYQKLREEIRSKVEKAAREAP